MVRRAGAHRRCRLRQLHPGLHRPRALLAEAIPGQEPPGHRRRHQVPGWSDDHPPRPDPPVPRPRSEARAHLPAQLRRQHRLPQHAGARAPHVEEDLEDALGDLPARLRHRRRQRAHRTLRLRALAERPQVGVHQARGPLVRRRSAQCRAEARSRRLAQLGRHRDRRRAMRQARARPRHRRSPRGAELLLHEVAPGAVQRQRGKAVGGGVHRR